MIYCHGPGQLFKIVISGLNILCSHHIYETCGIIHLSPKNLKMIKYNKIALSVITRIILIKTLENSFDLVVSM